jgi:SAM-dependent methyltransferase
MIFLNKIRFFFSLFGIDFQKISTSIKSVPFLLKNYYKLKNQLNGNNDFKITNFYPIFSDRFESSGVMSGHYFHQDLLVAKKIYKNNPIRHIDIGSRIDGFVAHVAIFRNIEIFDIRYQNSIVENIKFCQLDLMQPIDKSLLNCTDSLSSLHAIEHFGLGRYGDEVNFDGHLKALDNIYKMLKPNGKFYFSTPIGKQRIEFDAHRVFNLMYLIDYFNGKYEIASFSYVDDSGFLHENVFLSESNINSNFSCHLGCGIFELIKI